MDGRSYNVSRQDLRIKQIGLIVRNLEESLSFYQTAMGLTKITTSKDQSNLELVSLGVGKTPLLTLKHDPDSKPPSPHSSGLYHTAFLMPSRKSLASMYLTLGMAGQYFEGFADHGVSEAMYLRDPEGNGVEIYSDKPREIWPRNSNGKIAMVTEHLDLESLLSELSSDEMKRPAQLLDGAGIGHIHLKITNFEQSLKFYLERLGLQLMQSLWGSAAFLSYDGYHHHIGMNTWESSGGEKIQQGFSGLEYFALSVPNPPKLKETTLIDPDGIKIRLVE